MEREKILIIRLITIIICLLIFIIPFIVDVVNKVEIISDTCETRYYEYEDESYCKVTITIDKDVILTDNSKIKVEFFDVNEYSLGVYDSDFLNFTDEKQKHTYFNITGNVEYYEILDYELHVYNVIAKIICWGLAFFVFIFFIETLTLNYKRYKIANNEIIVYVGLFHHYIKINDVIADEHNTLITFSPIYLSCAMDQDNMINVTITTFNRISLQCNNMLVQPIK